MGQSENEITIEEIIDSFSERLERGERPSIEAYKQKYPEFAERIGAVLPALVLLENVDSGRSGRRLAVDDSIPEILGDYQIVREIGRGGMGIVFEAQHATMRRRVALKVLPKSSVEKSTYLERFLTEARSAGQLHHTNIVPVFEVGESEGLHFYSMQFIHGQNLDRVIEDIRALRGQSDSNGHSVASIPKTVVPVTSQSSLSQDIATNLLRAIAGHDLTQSSKQRPTPKQTIDKPRDLGQSGRNTKSTAPIGCSKGDEAEALSGSVFGGSDSSSSHQTKNAYHRRVAAVGVQVAQGLEHAHSHGVLHRDVKPANLILDTEGNVWITDFGLAKLETENLTMTGDIVGTLRYMAPERFGGDADRRSDIYSLGLTLYELCTLKCVFENDRGTLVKDVVTRSSVVSPRKIDATIPSDLETIILKAIEVQPQRRYQTAGEMADDLELFLSDRPIKARRITPSERLWRLCRRNPVIATLATSILLLLLTVAVGASLAAIRIHRQSQMLVEENERSASHLALTEKTMDRMLVRVGHELVGVPQMDSVRYELLSEALALQIEILALEPDNENVTLNTVEAYRRMAELQSQMGQHVQSMDTLKNTISLINSIPDDTEWKFSELANVHTLIGSALRQQGEMNVAEKSLGDAISALLSIETRDTQDAIRLADAYRQLGALREQTGAVEQAAEALENALAALDEIVDDESVAGGDKLSTLAEVLNSLAIIYRASGQLIRSEKTYQRVLELCRQMQKMQFRDIEAADQLGISALNFGNLLMLQRRNDEAADSYQVAADIYERLRRDFPMTVKYQRMVARTRLSLGLVHGARNDHTAAASAYQRAIEQCSALTALHGIDDLTRDTHAVCLTNLGNLLKREKRFEDAAEKFEKSIAIRRQMANEHQGNLANLKSLALSQANLADLHADEGRFEQALALFETAGAGIEALLEKNPDNPSYLRVADFVYRKLGDLSSLTGRYQDVVGWVDRRASLAKTGPNQKIKSVRSLEVASSRLQNDSDATDGFKIKYREAYARRAVELIVNAIELDWQPKTSLRETEGFGWLHDIPEFLKLIGGNSAGDQNP